MSRGIGRTQREIIRVLRDADGPLYPLALRREAGISDPTNARRSIRSLEQRGTVERDDEGCLGLTFIGQLQATMMDEPPEPDPLDELRRIRREFKEKMVRVRAENQGYERLYRQEEALWMPTRFNRKRHRSPGVNEWRVLAATARYSPDAQAGIPRPALVRIAEAGDPAVIRRAVNSLLDRGELQEDLDGGRVRLRDWHGAWLYEAMWDLVVPPLDDIEAQVVLEGYGEYLGTYHEGA